MATYSDNGSYREAIRTVNTNIVTDAALLNTTAPVVKLSAYGPYHAQNQQLGLLVTADRIAYNAEP